jgi:ABC-2 type transport system permease protein
MSFAPATMPWFAAHEARLMWRDGVAMMTGGYPARRIALIIVLVVAAVLLHLLANAIVTPWIAAGIVPDKGTLVLITGTGFLFWTVMLSQALESVTRAYYSRSDLDLIFSSPASSRQLFAVRTGITAATTLLLACLLASPVIDVLVLHDGPHWLMAYLVLAALSALSTAIAVLITVALFRIARPKRTRLISQIIAAVIGAGFVIGIQAIAILHFGNMSSRFAVFSDPQFVAAMPALDSLVWAPAKAALGDWPALLGLVTLGGGALVATIAFASSGYGQSAIAAASVGQQRATQQRGKVEFRPRSQKQQLRVKEWKLLARDPWLLSWLAISGEDAHDLVVTAPVSADAVLQAKIEAVATVVLVVLTPIIILMLFASLELAATTAVFAALSSGSATAIQLWFRVPMRRSMFRRRQVASRVSTIAEALSSIFWAGTAVLIAGDQYLIAILPAVLASITLAVAWSLSPKGKRV